MLSPAVAEGHKFLARLWDEVEVMSDEGYVTYVNKLKEILAWCLVSLVSFFLEVIFCRFLFHFAIHMWFWQ